MESRAHNVLQIISFASGPWEYLIVIETVLNDIATSVLRYITFKIDREIKNARFQHALFISIIFVSEERHSSSWRFDVI